MPRKVSLSVAVLVASLGVSSPQSKSADWPMWGGSPGRNMVSSERNIPAEWDVGQKKNIKWIAKLGSYTYGTPVVANGKVYVGTNNNGELRPNIKGDKGVLVCLEEQTGKFLWQATHDKMPSGSVNDWPEQGICSGPLVEGDRLYYVSNRCELICADAQGFLDGENDGPRCFPTISPRAHRWDSRTSFL